MVKVQGRNSNGKTVKQTAENGRKISGDHAARPAWVTGARRQQFAAASRFWSIPNLMPRWTVTRVWLTEHVLTWVSFVVHWHLTIFFFFLSFRECCLTRQWQRVECDTRYMVQRKKLDVILRFLVDRYRRTKPPKPDASQFVVPARLQKPVIGSGGLSSSRFDDDVPEVNCTCTASFSWRVKEAALWFESYRACKCWRHSRARRMETHGNRQNWFQTKIASHTKACGETGRSLPKVVFSSQGGLKSVGNFSTAYWLIIEQIMGVRKDLCGVWGCFRSCRRRSTGADIRPRTRLHGNHSTSKYDELVFVS